MNKPASVPANPGECGTRSCDASRRRIPLSAIVLTLDEEINIGKCLTCLDRVEEVILVDSGSTDRTFAKAREARSDVRTFHHAFQDFGDQRNWAIENTGPSHDWLLFVDADEFCTAELLDEIERFIQSPGRTVGAFVAGKYYFLGRWIKHASLYPSYQLRLLRRGAVRFRKEGHGQREIASGPLHYLSEAWVHEGLSKGIRHWIDRHNRYSTEEVELVLRLSRESMTVRELLSIDPIGRRRALKKLAARVPFRPATRFLYVYILRRGFLDGRPGLIFCLLRYAHDLHIVAKLTEHRHKETHMDLRSGD